ncbi:MAG: thioredoxin [Acidobacteriota bacterium]
MRQDWVIEVGDADFESKVLRASFEKPVLVDFWAEWCTPCRVLGPVLEKLAEEYQGAFILAKVNTERAPALTQLLQIQSIPLVVLFRDGRPVDQFIGALPEPEVRNFLSRHIVPPANSDLEQAYAALARGQLHQAERIFRRVLREKPDEPGALLGLARVHLLSRQEHEAKELLKRIPPTAAESEEAQALLTYLDCRKTARDGGSCERLERRVQEDPADLEARYQLARCLIGQDRFEAALEHLLEIVRRDRSFRDDGARKLMIDVFRIVGDRSELAERYRSKLAQVLF